MRATATVALLGQQGSEGTRELRGAWERQGRTPLRDKLDVDVEI